MDAANVRLCFIFTFGNDRRLPHHGSDVMPARSPKTLQERAFELDLWNETR